MNDESILDSNIDRGLSLGTNDMNYLRTSAKWAKFLGIVGFIFCGIFVALAIAMMFFMGSMMSELEGISGGLGGVGFGSIYLILAIPYFFISLFLYRFGSRTSQGVQSSNMDEISTGFEQLSKFFSVSGILTAIILGFYVLLILIGGLGIMTAM